MGCLTLIVSLLVLWKKRHVGYVAKRNLLTTLGSFFATLLHFFCTNERTGAYKSDSAGIKGSLPSALAAAALIAHAPLAQELLRTILISDGSYGLPGAAWT